MTTNSAKVLDMGTERLERRLRDLIDREKSSRDVRRKAVETRMRELDGLRERFEGAARVWMTGLVLPRLEALARMLARSPGVTHTSGNPVAALSLGSSREVPFGASLVISIVPACDYRRAAVRIEPQLIPMLAGNPAATTRSWDVEPECPPQLADFLDDGIVAFTGAYLAAASPGSPYMKGAFVTDPVCGMSVIPAEAADPIEHDGRRYYFCTGSCAARFRESPERWTVHKGSVPMGRGGG